MQNIKWHSGPAAAAASCVWQLSAPVGGLWEPVSFPVTDAVSSLSPYSPHQWNEISGAIWIYMVKTIW